MVMFQAGMCCAVVVFVISGCCALKRPPQSRHIHLTLRGRSLGTLVVSVGVGGVLFSGVKWGGGVPKVEDPAINLASTGPVIDAV